MLSHFTTPLDVEYPPRQYWHDLWRTDAGSERVLSTGPFVVTPDARKPAAA